MTDVLVLFVSPKPCLQFRGQADSEKFHKKEYFLIPRNLLSGRDLQALQFFMTRGANAGRTGIPYAKRTFLTMAAKVVIWAGFGDV
jgi:hypothetical protein